MEGLCPGFFVEVGYEVVVAEANRQEQRTESWLAWDLGSVWEHSLVHEGHVLSLPSLSTAFNIASVAIAGPMSDVLASDGSMGLAIFL